MASGYGCAPAPAARSSRLVVARVAASCRPEVLPAEHRMRRSRDFDRVVRAGTRRGRRCLVVHVLKDDDAEHRSLAGFVVSRAVGGAVVRNRVKRRMRAVLAQHWDLMPPGGCVVVRALPAAAAAPYAQIEAELTSVLRSAGELRPAGRAQATGRARARS